MNVIEPGRSYELNGAAVLHFIQKDGAAKVRDGTTNEEVLEVLIERAAEAYQVVPCRETVRALYLLYEALSAFRLRRERRMTARVEGTNKPHDSEAHGEQFARLQGSMRNQCGRFGARIDDALAQSPSAWRELSGNAMRDRR